MLPRFLRRAVDALAERRIRAVVDAMPDGVMALDSEWRIRSVNRPAETLLGRIGHDARQVMGRAFWRALPELVGAISEREYRRALADGRSVAFGASLPLLGLWLEIHACPTLDGVVVHLRDVTERRRAQDELGRLVAREAEARVRADQARQRVAFFAQASRALTQSLDYESTLQTLARVPVPSLADLCVIDVLQEGRLHRAAAAHRDPGKEAVAADLQQRFPPDPAGPHPVAVVLRTGRPEIVNDITDDMLERIAPHPEHRAIARTLKYTGYMVVPISVQGRVLGAISLVSGESNRRYGPEDLALAEDLAQQAAIAVENARLYAEAQERRQEAEEMARGARALVETLDLPRIGQRIVQVVLSLLRAQSCTLRLLRPDGATVLVALAPERHQRAPADVLGPGVGTAGLAAREGVAVWTADALGDPRITLTEGMRAWMTATGTSAILAAPLRAEGRTIGVLALADFRGRVYRERDVALVQGFADQVALAVDRARLHAESEQRRRDAEHAEARARFLAEAGAALAASLDYEMLLVKLPGLAVPFLADWCWVDVIAGADGVRRLPVAHGDRGKADLAMRLDACGPGALPERADLVPAVDDERLRALAHDDEGRAVLRALAPESLMRVPLVARGEVLGAMTLVSAGSGRRYTGADLLVAQGLAERAATAIDNARLFRDSEARRREAEALGDVGRHLAESLDPAEVGRRTVETVRDLLDTRMAVLYQADPASGELRMLAGVGPTVEWNPVMPRGTATVGLAIETRQPVTTPDVLSDPRIVLAPPSRARIERSGYRAVLAVPLLVQGRVVGALAVGDLQGRRFSADEARLLQTFASEAALALDNARLYAEEHEARRAAEEASRTKDEFLAMLSHELRTPLTAMLGWVSMLRGGRLEPAAAARGLEAVERNARLQLRLIEDLLDVSRIITGKFQLDPRPVDPGPVVEAAFEAVRPAAEAKGIRVEIALDRSAGPVWGDPARLQQVVWNLLSNAVKFTPRHGAVDVRLAREGAEVAIVVADTGIGIATDVLPHVFERFRQADSSTTRRHGGLGLGLAIVRHIVDAHGGTVEAASPGEGKGAVFTVRLPLITPALVEPGDGGGAEPDAREDLAGVRVLVVDDDVDTLELVRVVLTAAGAEVRTALDAAGALAALREWRPDVLLADIGLPGEDGYALIHRVRALDAREGGRVPAGALTAYARASDRQRALASGFHAYLAKPVEPAALRRATAQLAGRG